MSLSLDDYLKYLNPKNSEKSIKELFEERLEKYGLSQFQVERMLNLERKSLEGILDKTAKRVDFIKIVKLGLFLDIDPAELLEKYLKELPDENYKDYEQTKKAAFIVKTFDINNLYKSGFINSKKDFNLIEKRITSFFGLTNIFDYQNQNLFPFYSKTKKSSKNQMLDFWITSAYRHFQGINNPHEYNRDEFLKLVPKIRPYTINVEKGLFTVSQALYNCGVTVIYQPYLPTTQVRGATFLVNDKPCIVLTDFNKNYPTIWFALMHEIYHVLYDLEHIKDNIYHITGEVDLLLVQEEEANQFAGEYLFSQERRRYIAPFIDNELIVQKFALEAQVHPSIIYNIYMYETNKWQKFHSKLPDIQTAVKMLNTNPWNQETILESIKQLKETVFNF